MRLFFGVIFIYGAPEARLPILIFVLGVLMLLGAMFIFILGVEKARAILGRWGKNPDSLLRLFSLLILALGALVVYAA